MKESARMNIGIKSVRSRIQEKIKITMPTAIFPVIDADRVSKDIKLLEEARILGEKELPLTTQKTRFGTSEMRVDTQIQDLATEYHSVAIKLVSNLDRQITKDCAETKGFNSDVRLLPKKFAQEIKTRFKNNLSFYNASKDNYQLTKKEYEQFRNENDLTRTANIKTKTGKTLSVLLILIFIFIEAFANSSLFATSLEGGLLSGFLIAALASCVNVVCSALIGYFGIRQINHVNKKRKTIGFLSLLGLVGVIALVGLGVGHYRDAMQILDSSLKPEIVALQTFIESPLALSDIYSWLLFSLTVLFGIFACYDAYHFDDAYPGYSEMALKYETAREDWATTLEEWREELNSVSEEYIDLIDVKVKAADNGLNSIKGYVLDKNNILVAYEEALRSAQKAYETLISMFRSENTKYRTTPVPGYFMDAIELDLSELPAITTPQTDNALIQGLEMDLGILHNDIDEVREKIVSETQVNAQKIDAEREVL